ncbi:MAG: hypothetical protein ACI81R_002145, partial [Bradymonadia bacterium]
TCPGCGANVYAFVRTGKETKAARLAMLDVPISWASPLVADAETQRSSVMATPHGGLGPPRHDV